MTPRKTASFGLAALAAVAILLPAPAGAEAGAAGLKVAPGDSAPTFSLPTSDNQTLSLEGLVQEKPLFVVFWSIFCQPCKEELPILSSLSGKYKAKVNIVGINIDHPRLRNAVMQYLKKADFKFPILLEQVEGEGSNTIFKTADAFGVKETPIILGILPGKKVFFTHVGRMEEKDLAKLIEDAADKY